MTYFPLTKDQRRWRELAEVLARDVLEPRAAATDRDAAFPGQQLAALRSEGLMGLRGDREQGGAGGRAAHHLPGRRGPGRRLPFDGPHLQDAPGEHRAGLPGPDTRTGE